jgi:hypothetical protein
LGWPNTTAPVGADQVGAEDLPVSPCELPSSLDSSKLPVLAHPKRPILNLSYEKLDKFRSFGVLKRKEKTSPETWITIIDHSGDSPKGKDLLRSYSS